VERVVTVAVVDGNAGAREGLVTLLRQLPGIRVVGQAADQGDALVVASAHQPDVILADLRRITRNGAEFLGLLAAVAPGARVVVLSAYLTEEERGDLARAGAHAFLLKEIDSEALVGAIRSVTEPVAGEKRRSGT
jgi:DNA-binding NarL/FixJ family response regulator